MKVRRGLTGRRCLEPENYSRAIRQPRVRPLGRSRATRATAPRAASRRRACSRASTLQPPHPRTLKRRSRDNYRMLQSARRQNRRCSSEPTPGLHTCRGTQPPTRRGWRLRGPSRTTAGCIRRRANPCSNRCSSGCAPKQAAAHAVRLTDGSTREIVAMPQ